MNNKYTAIAIFAIIAIALLMFFEIRQQDEKQLEGQASMEKIELAVSIPSEITYSLSEKGYIERVVIKDKKEVIVVESKTTPIVFSHIEDGKDKYQFRSNGTLAIYSSKYPSDKYVVVERNEMEDIQEQVEVK